ncbi:MAG: hypothetical protein HZC44_02305 [Geobacter sp.]|nr:hypothetical protein [Geobacter sp.]
MREKKEICVFVSSPGDVSTERDIVEDVVQRINKTLGDELMVFVKVKRWEDIPPCAGSVQETINTHVGPYDIFLGIMWERFGSPTSNAESGTQEELKSAYESWKSNGSVAEILFYFRENTSVPRNADAAEQLLKVIRFREELSSKLKYTLYREPIDFERLVRDDLEHIVRKLLNKTTVPKSINVENADIEKVEQVWDAIGVASSFKPNNHEEKQTFYRARIQTTSGYIAGKEGVDELKSNFILVSKDPIRPFDIQIGETRSLRQAGNPTAIPDLTILDLGSVKSMYPFLQVEGYRWIRMVLAELTTDQKILDFIYENDTDPQVRSITAKNPSASSDLQQKECKFCQDRFRFLRDLRSGSDKTFIIANDFPYGPYFHYIAFPAQSIHAWQDLELPDIHDMNLTIWRFLKREQKAGKWLPAPAGVFIGLNSSIRHLVMGTRTRTSAGASITHVHKQIWGMAPGSVNLGNHLDELCRRIEVKGGYLHAYLQFLRREKMVIHEDDHVVLYVPYGQISIHEMQIMVKKPGTTHYLALSEEEITSLSIAETIAVKLLDALGIHSFNQVMITLPFDRVSAYFSLILCFVTREVDLAVSELNHLFVVDKYPEETRELLAPIKESIIKQVMESATGIAIS